jgi:hypothetical protein
MTLNVNIRNLIKSHYDDGKSAREIHHALNKTVKKRTIYNWLRIIDRNKSVKQKSIPGRPRTKRTKKLISIVEKNRKAGARRKSANKLAKENDCCRRTIHNILYKDLAVKPYKRIRCQALTEKQKIKRKQFCCWVRKNISTHFVKKIMFSDEKIFDEDGQINYKNEIIYAKSREEANTIGGLHEEQKYPMSVMVWCGITWNGVVKVVVLPHKTTFNSIFYVENVLPVIKRDGLNLIGEDMVYQQDGARPHTSKLTKKAFKTAGIEFLHDGFWPPNSPDLNPMDYFFWNQVESFMPKKKYSDRENLVKEIKKSVSQVSIKMIRDSFENFKPRCSAVEKANGGIIKNVFF